MPAHPRHRRLRSVAWVAACALSVGVAACAAPTPDRAELTDALAASGLPQDVARCAADALLSELSQEELDVLVERGNGGVPVDDPDRDDDPADRLRAALADCQELLPTTTLAPAASSVPSTGVVDPDPTSTTTSASPSTEKEPTLEPGPSSSPVTVP